MKLPIIFPLLYGLLIYLFPHHEMYIIFLFILLLAEPHFAATWPFFLDKVNKDFIIKNKIIFIIIPIFIIVASLIGYFFITSLFLLIFFAANMYHVTRQSFGISNLYLKKFDEKKYQEYSIYFFNLLFFLLGIARFYLNLEVVDKFIYEILYCVLILLCINFTVYLIKYELKNISTLISGTIIFFPVCFVQNPIHVIIMGVTMHYSQYLFLTHKIFLKRNNYASKLSKKYIFYFLIIFLYTIIMSFFSISKSFDVNFLKHLIIIPITGQMLHFYLDSQLWKFSKEHNKKNILAHILDN